MGWLVATDCGRARCERRYMVEVPAWPVPCLKTAIRQQGKQFGQLCWTVELNRMGWKILSCIMMHNVNIVLFLF